MKTAWIAAGIALSALSAPTYASERSATAESTIIVSGQFQKDWQRGSTLEAEGLKAMEKARKELVKHSADVVEAQTKRDLANQRAANARASFEALTVNGSVSATSKDAHRWAKQVEEAASEWEKQEERGSDGSKDLEKALKKQTKAQAAVDKAQAKVDLGRKLKADAELASVAQS
ncbi:hypothetical protein ACRAQ6_08015 [Erythrobacter sp. HA6-11]